MLSRNEVLFLEFEEAQPSLALTPESLRASSPLGRGAGAAQLPPVLCLSPAVMVAAWHGLGKGAGLWSLTRVIPWKYLVLHLPILPVVLV